MLSLAIGYPVAYYVSRHAHGRDEGRAAVLLVAPFWISYLMRMFAWTNLLDSRRLRGGGAQRAVDRRALRAVGLLDGDDWLGGQPIAVILGLVYGYVPYLILPLYASLDRIDQRLIEAARDLGASPAQAFRRVVLPLSKAGTLGGIVLIALPMFGDYYTPDLMSGSPETAMLGNTINNYVQGGPDKALGAAMTLLLSAFLLIFMLYYLRVAAAGGSGVTVTATETRRRRHPSPPARPPASPRSRGSTSRGRCCRCCWRSASRSTRGARGRPRRASRCAGSGPTRR